MLGSVVAVSQRGSSPRNLSVVWFQFIFFTTVHIQVYLKWSFALAFNFFLFCQKHAVIPEPVCNIPRECVIPVFMFRHSPWFFCQTLNILVFFKFAWDTRRSVGRIRRPTYFPCSKSSVAYTPSGFDWNRVPGLWRLGKWRLRTLHGGSKGKKPIERNQFLGLISIASP